MKRNRSKEDLDIDVGAFADIAFLLIIFFILTTSIMQIMGRDVSIPSSEQSDQKTDDENRTVVLTGTEIQYGMGDKTVAMSFEELRANLSEERFPEMKDAQNRVVVVESRVERSGDWPGEVPGGARVRLPARR